ncbi:SPS1 Serine/threonine protein kinase [Candidatus Nanopelagicaceae bacterium]
MDALQPKDPKRLGGWSLTGRLGAGGMGAVYMGNKAGKTAAIKVIHSEDLKDPHVRKRFVQEIQSLSLLRTPYVARLLDYDLEAKKPWYAVEYISDMSLADVLRTTGNFSGDNWWRLAQNLLMALVSIHDADVIHRDLKPGNIMIAKGEPKLIDFGLAKPIADQFGGGAARTQAAVSMGTPTYMSPEQWISARDVDGKTDIWAVGVTLIDAAGGKPWGEMKPGEIRSALQKGKSPDVSKLDVAQRALVIDMVHSDPNDRLDARALLKRLESYYNTRPEPVQEVKVQVRNVAQPQAAAPAPIKQAAKERAPKPPNAAKEPGILKKANSWGSYLHWWREYPHIFVLTLLTGGWALFPYLIVYYVKPTRDLSYKKKVVLSQSLAVSTVAIGFLNPLITFLWWKLGKIEGLKKSFYIYLGLWIWQIFSTALIGENGKAPAYVGISWIAIYAYGFFIYKPVLAHLKASN